MERSGLLVGRDHDLKAAHVGLQHLGDGHGAVGLQVVLQECDQHTRRCHAGVVQGVGQIGLAVLALDADVQTAGFSTFYECFVEKLRLSPSCGWGP